MMNDEIGGWLSPVRFASLRRKEFVCFKKTVRVKSCNHTFSIWPAGGTACGRIVDRNNGVRPP